MRNLIVDSIVKIQRLFDTLSPTQKNELYLCAAVGIGLFIGIII